MSATLVRAHRRDLDELLRLALGDLSLVFGRVDANSPYAVREALQDLLPGLVAVYGSAAATLGADWYDEMREAAAVKGGFRAIPAELPDRGRTDSLARFAIGPLFGAEPDLTSAKALAEGGFQRIVADADRNTVLGSSAQDPWGGRWTRETTGKSCSFCLMLATRDNYLSESSGGFLSHDNCDCIAVPAFRRP